MLPEDECTRDRGAPASAEVDLERRRSRFGGAAGRPFEIDAEIKHRLLNGLDDIALTLQQAATIDAYEPERERAGPGHHGRLSGA